MRTTRRMRDMSRSRREMRDMRRRSSTTGRYMADRNREPYSEREDYGRGRRDYGEYYPISIRGEVGRMHEPYDGNYRMGGMDYGRSRRDYGEPDYLSDDELMEWSKKLYEEIDPNHKQYFTRDNIERKYKELGIELRDFTFDELYTTALMLATDYGKTLTRFGINSPDMFLYFAKDFLEDDDADLVGGEKLAAYYDNIVCVD